MSNCDFVACAYRIWYIAYPIPHIILCQQPQFFVHILLCKGYKHRRFLNYTHMTAIWTPVTMYLPPELLGLSQADHEELLISQSQSKMLESARLCITSHACSIKFTSIYRLLWFGKVPPGLHTIGGLWFGSSVLDQYYYTEVLIFGCCEDRTPNWLVLYTHSIEKITHTCS